MILDEKFISLLYDSEKASRLFTTDSSSAFECNFENSISNHMIISCCLFNHEVRKLVSKSSQLAIVPYLLLCLVRRHFMTTTQILNLQIAGLE